MESSPGDLIPAPSSDLDLTLTPQKTTTTAVPFLSSLDATSRGRIYLRNSQGSPQTSTHRPYPSSPARQSLHQSPPHVHGSCNSSSYQELFPPTFLHQSAISAHIHPLPFPEDDPDLTVTPVKVKGHNTRGNSDGGSRNRKTSRQTARWKEVRFESDIDSTGMDEGDSAEDSEIALEEGDDNTGHWTGEGESESSESNKENQAFTTTEEEGDSETLQNTEADRLMGRDIYANIETCVGHVRSRAKNPSKKCDHVVSKGVKASGGEGQRPCTTDELSRPIIHTSRALQNQLDQMDNLSINIPKVVQEKVNSSASLRKELQAKVFSRLNVKERQYSGLVPVQVPTEQVLREANIVKVERASSVHQTLRKQAATVQPADGHSYDPLSLFFTSERYCEDLPTTVDSDLLTPAMPRIPEVPTSSTFDLFRHMLAWQQ